MTLRLFSSDHGPPDRKKHDITCIGWESFLIIVFFKVLNIASKNIGGNGSSFFSWPLRKGNFPSRKALCAVLIIYKMFI
jgi:hypothetical protein